MTVQLKNACDNLNHRRAHVTIRHCPSCGELINDRVDARRCGEAKHATARIERSEYCADCGTRLIIHN